jgi:transcription elongation factor GreA
LYLCTHEEFRFRDSFFLFIRIKRIAFMSKITFITQDGLEKLRQELEQLINVERPAMSKQIADARDKGDLSENAEYHAAKEAQGLLELRISKLQDIVANARVLDESQVSTEKVQILNRVKIRNTGNNAVMKYHIVPESEADLKAGKMSVGTPIAQGLLGKKVGDFVRVKVPSGEIGLEILEISI